MRSEYPRPQFYRTSWLCLNGEWDFAFDYGKSGCDRGWYKNPEFTDKIIVPFCPESSLSGLAHTDFIESVFYARKIAIPADWAGKDILLHFGAVDYEATIWIDGVKAGFHQGGSSSFVIDISKFVCAGQEHTVVVHAADDLRSGLQGGGKQSDNYYSRGCHYTRVTGIWQTVWLEAVHPSGLLSCRIVPDFDNATFALTPQYRQSGRGYKLITKLIADEREIATVETAAVSGATFTIAIPEPRAWSPDAPFLYDLNFELRDAAGNIIDQVQSYAGLRKIHIEGDKVYLNNKTIFQRQVLDQGYYPDGIWTAPTDNALKHDIQLSQAAGFNGARLHQKVFEERFHYWADRLGYLTWAEYPSWNLDLRKPEACYHFLNEWRELVEQLQNHPSIITWTPFNESVQSTERYNSFAKKTQFENYQIFLTAVYDLTRQLDPTRPINDTSGYQHVKTDLWTIHAYRADAESLAKTVRSETGEVYVHYPEFEKCYNKQPYLVDEFGGFKYIPAERRDSTATGWGYHGIEIQTADELCAKIAEQVDVFLADPGVSGYCYTQLTDVEQEQNGVYNYDRSAKASAQSLQAVFGKRSPHFEQ